VKAHHRPSYEVWQYTGHTPPPGWVIGCVELRPNGELYLRRRSGLQLIRQGEWLIRDLDGEPSWATDAEFARDYQLEYDMDAESIAKRLLDNHGGNFQMVYMFWYAVSQEIKLEADRREYEP
jgi:hypothetical protein